MANKEKITKILLAVRAVLVFIVVINIVIALFIIAQRNRDAKQFNHRDFPESLAVNNMTDYEKADTISLYLAQQFGIPELNLIIVYIPEDINEEKTEFYGIVQQLPFKTNQFIILFDREEMSLTELKETLSHEFVHINQCISGDLVIYPNFAIWRGEDVYFGETNYKERPFEMEAFSKQRKVKKKLDKALYK